MERNRCADSPFLAPTIEAAEVPASLYLTGQTMERRDLIASATRLGNIAPEAVAEFAAKRDEILAAVNARLMARADINALVGPDNIDLMKDNHANHARFIESILTEYQPAVLVDTILWVFRAYRARGFQTAYWAAQLNAWTEVFEEILSAPTVKAIGPLYDWMIVNIPHFADLTQRPFDTTTSGPGD